MKARVVAFAASVVAIALPATVFADVQGSYLNVSNGGQVYVPAAASQFYPHPDPIPARAPLRAPVIGANDNIARGIGKSAAILNDDLRLVMSAQEANSRTARYMRGVGAAVAGSGTYASRLGKIGKIGKPIGALLTLYAIGDALYSLFNSSDTSDTTMWVSSSNLTTLADANASGKQLFSGMLTPGGLYSADQTFWSDSAKVPGLDYPLGRDFIVARPATGSTWHRAMVTYVSQMPSDYTGPFVSYATTGTDTFYSVYQQNGAWYRLQQKQIQLKGSVYAGTANSCYWVAGTPPYYEYKCGTAVPLPEYNPDKNVETRAPARPSTTPTPPEHGDAALFSEPFIPLVQTGLDNAGLSVPDATKQRMADAVASQGRARDLNATPDPATYTEPATSPVGAYVPQEAADAAAEPSVPSTPGGSNGGTETPPAGSSKVDQEIEAEDPGDAPTLPTVDVGSFTYQPEACHNPSMNFQFDTQIMNETRDRLGVPAYVEIDICYHLNRWASFFGALFTLMWTVLAFRVARNG